jgi:hypothetical protein
MLLDQQRRFLMQDCCIKKLLVFSDLHLEHKPNWSLPESGGIQAIGHANRGRRDGMRH